MATDLANVQNDLTQLRPMAEIVEEADRLQIEVSNFIATPPVVNTDEDIDLVNMRAIACRGIRESIAELFKMHADILHRAHRSVTARRTEYTAPMEAWERAANNAILARQEQVRREAAEAAQKAQREADDAARREREAQIEQAVESGDARAAEELAAAPIEAAPAIIPAVARVVPTGMTQRETWVATVTDVAAAKANLPREYLTPDESLLNALAKSTRGPSPYKGVIFERKLTASRRRV